MPEPFALSRGLQGTTVTSGGTSVSNRFNWGTAPATITLDIDLVQHAEAAVETIQNVVGATDVLLWRESTPRPIACGTAEAAIKQGYPGGYAILHTSLRGQRRFFHIDPTSSWLQEQLWFPEFPLSITLLFRPTSDDEAVVFTDDCARWNRSTVWLGSAAFGTFGNIADSSDDWAEPEAAGVAGALGPAKVRLREIRNEAVVTEAILELAEQVIVALAQGSLVPSRVVVTADRELAFVFFGVELVEGGAHRFVATLTCSGEDGLSVLTQDRRAPRTQTWDLDVPQLSETLEQICAFVSGR